jgi:hypothetical protein
MSIKLDNGSTVSLGRSRNLLDMSAPIDRILAEVARWDVDPHFDAINLFDGEVFMVRHEGEGEDGLTVAARFEVLWLPRASAGAVNFNGETSWGEAESAGELLADWASRNLAGDLLVQPEPGF